ncbi:MAG TPA: class I SAM-dependent methyltransferase [Roseiflexaceae bacterium]|nr:class I SAM-dependent methyltransferase [Roseiflexaceae bacterium]
MTTSRSVCPICHGPVAAAFGGRTWPIGQNGRVFGYLACAACGLIFCDPPPSEAELERYYAGAFNYDWYSQRRLQKRAQGYHRWLRVGQMLERRAGGPAHLLDIGCGAGWFLHAARRAGWQVAGIELSRDSVAFATARLGLDVTLGALESIAPPTSRYDAITLWHSLEHMRDPRQALAWIRAALKPGGVVLIAVPNVESRGLARRGAGWIWLQQPFVHLWHFSARALGLLLEQSALRVLSVGTRDTWDAQYVYDAVLAPQLEGRYYRKLALETERGLRRLRVGRAREAAAGLLLALSETSRLLSYALSLPSTTLRPRRADGSELLVLAGARP